MRRTSSGPRPRQAKEWKRDSLRRWLQHVQWRDAFTLRAANLPLFVRHYFAAVEAGVVFSAPAVHAPEVILTSLHGIQARRAAGLHRSCCSGGNFDPEAALITPVTRKNPSVRAECLNLLPSYLRRIETKSLVHNETSPLDIQADDFREHGSGPELFPQSPFIKDPFLGVIKWDGHEFTSLWAF